MKTTQFHSQFWFLNYSTVQIIQAPLFWEVSFESFDPVNDFMIHTVITQLCTVQIATYLGSPSMCNTTGPITATE